MSFLTFCKKQISSHLNSPQALEAQKEGNSNSIAIKVFPLFGDEENYLRRYFSQFNYVALWNFYLFSLMMFCFLCAFLCSLVKMLVKKRETRDKQDKVISLTTILCAVASQWEIKLQLSLNVKRFVETFSSNLGVFTAMLVNSA